MALPRLTLPALVPDLEHSTLGPSPPPFSPSAVEEGLPVSFPLPSDNGDAEWLTESESSSFVPSPIVCLPWEVRHAMHL